MSCQICFSVAQHVVSRGQVGRDIENRVTVSVMDDGERRGRYDRAEMLMSCFQVLDDISDVPTPDSKGGLAFDGDLHSEGCGVENEVDLDGAPGALAPCAHLFLR